MKYLLKSSFTILIVSSLVLGLISMQNKEWEALTASISLIIAIISGWIAYEGFHRQSLQEKPQIILRLDLRSRYGLILLVAENIGKKPAFNIVFKWNQNLLNHKGEIVSFNKYDKHSDIPVLNINESTSVLIDSHSSFFEKYKDDELNYSGIIEFQESLYSKRKQSYPFHFSLKHYAKSLSFENEEPKTMYEIQKIPKKLDEINVELKKMNKLLSLNNNIE